MTCEQCYVCEQTVLQCSRTMLLAMTYDLCHGGHMVAEYPLLHTPCQYPPPLSKEEAWPPLQMDPPLSKEETCPPLRFFPQIAHELPFFA